METFSSQSQTFVPPPGGLLSEKNSYFTAVMSALTTHKTLLTTALNQLTSQALCMAELAQRLIEILQNGHKVLVVGNGGSAAEAQHFAAELVGRFQRERASYPVMALTTDTAILTAIANDYGYQEVFARQVRAFGQACDLLIALSTSGESENVIRAVEAAHKQGMTVAALISKHSCRLARLADLTIQVPTLDATTTQELHLVVTHLLCEIVEERLAAQEKEHQV